jgi:SAM-dependent methyltransferase
MPSPHDIEAIYASPAYTESYDGAGQQFVVSQETASQTHEPRFARLEKYLPNRGGLLDIGASRGIFMDQAKQRGWHVHGLEAGADAIAFAQSEFQIAIQHGTLESTLLPNAFYDCVHLSHVLEHLHQPRERLQQIATALKPGGILVVEVPYEFGDLFDLFRARVLGRQRTPNQVPSSHLYFFTLATLSRLLRQSGFEILFGNTPRRNQSYESRLPLGVLLKKLVYRLEYQLHLGPLIEVYARKI